MFLETEVVAQAGLFALLPQVADAISIPVIAAGGIAEARGIVAALALGASGVQLGTAYLLCPEANISLLYRQALERATDTSTAITNLFSGRPARGIRNCYLDEAGPMSENALDLLCCDVGVPSARGLGKCRLIGLHATVGWPSCQIWKSGARGSV